MSNNEESFNLFINIINNNININNTAKKKYFDSKNQRNFFYENGFPKYDNQRIQPPKTQNSDVLLIGEININSSGVKMSDSVSYKILYVVNDKKLFIYKCTAIENTFTELTEENVNQYNIITPLINSLIHNYKKMSDDFSFRINDIIVTKKLNYFQLKVYEIILNIFKDNQYIEKSSNNNIINLELFSLLENVREKGTSIGGVKYVKTEERYNNKVVYKLGKKKYLKVNNKYISLTDYKKEERRK
jgi:hypothetical protein